MTIELIQGLLLAFALVVILMRPYMRIVRRLGVLKRIRVEGPQAHYTKEGSPTMGGLLLITVVGVTALELDLVDASTFAPLAALALVGLLGAADDVLNAKTGDGIRARQKLLWLIVVALAGVGLETNLASLKAIGFRPFYAGLCAATFMAVVSFGLIRIFGIG